MCNGTHLKITIENLGKFNARRRLKGAVVDAFANRLAYYHTRPGNGQSPNLFADSATSYGAIGQVLDSLDEIDVLRQDETNELAQVLDDSALHKWLDIYDGISSLDMSQKRIPHPDGEGSVLKDFLLEIINIKLQLESFGENLWLYRGAHYKAGQLASY